jgi:hypothetical protein
LKFSPSLFGADGADGDDDNNRYDSKEDFPFQTGCGNLRIILRLSLLGQLEALDGNGGRIVTVGTPDEIKSNPQSITGRYI